MPSYKNGYVPAGRLEDLKGTPNAELRRDAANAWNRAWDEIHQKLGMKLRVVGWNRTYAEQKAIFLARYKPRMIGGTDARWWKGRRYVRVSGAPAAVPGTSNHGWGTAVDIENFGGYGNFSSSRRAKALPILRKHGFSDAEGRQVREPWHFVYIPSQDKGKGAKKKGGLKKHDKRFSKLVDRVQLPTGRYNGKKKWTARPKGQKIKGVNIHHWAGTNMSGYRRLVESNDPASANYLILNSGELVGSVPEEYRAWTTSSFEADKDKITIEIQNETGSPEWKISDAAMNTLVELLDERAEHHGFKLNRNTVKGHREYGVPTACPGPWLFPRLAQVVELARQGKRWAKGAEYVGGGSSNGGLVVDGVWGPATTRRLQELAGTPQDGVVSSQSSSWKAQNPGLKGGWSWVVPSRARGSRLILSAQRKLKKAGRYKGKLDGLVGPKFFRALQQDLGTPVDGRVSDPSTMVRALQRRANAGRGF